MRDKTSEIITVTVNCRAIRKKKKKKRKTNFFGFKLLFYIKETGQKKNSYVKAKAYNKKKM